MVIRGSERGGRGVVVMYETSILREWESGIMSNNRESLTAKERRERAQGLKSQALQRDLEL